MITRVCPYSVHRGGKGATIYCKYVNYINYMLALGYYGAEVYDILMTFSTMSIRVRSRQCQGFPRNPGRFHPGSGLSPSLDQLGAIEREASFLVK